MTITAAELAAVREWVPATWTPTTSFNDAAVSATWDRVAATLVPDPDNEDTVQAAADASVARVYATALALTRTFKSILLGDPDSFSVGGEYSESRGAALNALMVQETTLAGLAGMSAAVVTGTGRLTAHQLTRPNFYGR